MFYKVSFYEPIIEGYLSNRFNDKDLAVNKADRLIQNGYEEVKIQCCEKIIGSDAMLITDFHRVDKPRIESPYVWKPVIAKKEDYFSI